jgi:hypothetical protein
MAFAKVPSCEEQGHRSSRETRPMNFTSAEILLSRIFPR